LLITAAAYKENREKEEQRLPLDKKYLLRIEAIASNTLKDAVDVRRGAHKLISPKVVLRVANQNTPRMRLQKNQPSTNEKNLKF
jgi:hypothetical protein